MSMGVGLAVRASQTVNHRIGDALCQGEVGRAGDEPDSGAVAGQGRGARAALWALLSWAAAGCVKRLSL